MTNNVFDPPAIVRPAEDLAALLATAKAEHSEGMRAERASLEHYRRAGLALARAKEAAGHGNWLAALKQTGISQQRASEYMRLAARWHKLPPGGDFALKEAIRLVADEPEPLPLEPEPPPPRVPAEPVGRIEHEPLAMPNAAAAVDGDPDREAGPEDGGADESPREEDDPPAEQGVWRDREGRPVVLLEQPAALASPLKYHGGKKYLAPTIVALMQPHGTYVEPFCGSARVFFARDPADRRLWLPPHEGVSEVLNDLDGRLTNFFRVLQRPDTRERLLQLVEFTGFNEREWQEAAFRLDDPDPVTAAHAFFVRNRLSHAGRMDDFAGITRARLRRGMNEQVSALDTAVSGLSLVAARLGRALILNRPALKVVDQFDDPDALIYFDPTYMHGTRSAPRVYAYEMPDDDHRDLLARLKKLRAKAILSGYPSKLYDDALADWKRYEKDVPNHAAGGKKKDRETEVLWCNF
jgi:DNA adenine methylase